jgi:tetratricopeptide (TPR) repeat protein
LLCSYFAFHDPPVAETKDLIRKLEQMPMEEDQRIQFARIAFRTGDLEMAKTQASIVLKEHSGKIDALQILAEVYQREQEWPEFEEIASIIENFYRENESHEKAADYALDTARTMFRAEGKVKNAERLKRIIRKYPNYAPGYFELATVQKQTEPEKALANLQKAVRLDPENFIFSSRLAELYLELYMVSKAEEVYLRFSQSPKYREEAYVGLASCKQMAGRSHESIVLLQQALKQGGKSTRLLRELGRSYYQIGNYHKAAETYEEFAALIPQKPTGYLLAAEMYTRAGELTAAEEQYQLALEVDPNNREAQNALITLKESSQ